MDYIIKQLLWHPELNRYLLPGETNRLEHLGANEIKELLERNEIQVQEDEHGAHNDDRSVR